VGPEPLPGPRRASPEDASPAHQVDTHYRQHPEERHLVEETVRLPAEAAEELELLRGTIDEGASRGWKLLSAIKHPGGEVLLLTWDTTWDSLVSFSG
jgi:hypothetical protein